MTEDALAEWFLDVEGAKSGPYTPEQIAGLLEEGEILPHHKVTSEQLKGEWIPAEELVAAFRGPPPEPGAGDPPPAAQGSEGGGFQPPPRPAELDRPAGGSLATFEGKPPRNPARDLFETLQAARERKNAKLTPPAQAQSEWGNQTRPRFKFPAKAFRIAGMAVLSGLVLWGMVTLIRNRLNHSATTADSKSAEPAAPVGAAAHGFGAPPPNGIPPAQQSSLYPAGSSRPVGARPRAYTPGVAPGNSPGNSAPPNSYPDDRRDPEPPPTADWRANEERTFINPNADGTHAGPVRGGLISRIAQDQGGQPPDPNSPPPQDAPPPPDPNNNPEGMTVLPGPPPLPPE